MTIPLKWQKRFDNSDIKIEETMSNSVDDSILNQLKKLEPFNIAIQEGSLATGDFDAFAPVILTIRYFTECYEDALEVVKDLMLPDPTK